MLTPNKRLIKKKSGEIERFILLLDAINLTMNEFAEIAGVSPRTIKNCVYEDKPLGAEVLRAAHLKLGVSVDWLLSGMPPMMLSTDDNGNERLNRLTDFLASFMASASSDEQAWLEVQIRRAVHEYEFFSRKRGGENNGATTDT